MLRIRRDVLWLMTRGWVVTVLLSPLASGPSAGAEIDPVTSGRLAMRFIRDRDGLPQNTVHAVTLDRQGQLWVGTQDGAAVSNGRGWRVVDMPGRMQANFVRTILAARDGSLWFGTQGGGLHRLFGDRWETASLPCPDAGTVTVTALLETHEPPEIWAATLGCGVVRQTSEGWVAYDRGQGVPSDRVWGLHWGSPGGTEGPAVWAGTEGGVAVLDAESDRFVAGMGFPMVSANTFLEVPGSGGPELWVGTYGEGVYRRRAGKWSVLNEAGGLPSGFVTSLARHRKDGPVWVGTDGGGLAAVWEDRVEVVNVGSGLSSNAVYALFAAGAEEGGRSLWVGTRSGGLVQILEGRWMSYQPLPEAPSLPVLAVVPVSSERGGPAVWFGTDGGGLTHLHEGVWTTYDMGSGTLPSDTVQCVLETVGVDGKPVLWVGTRHGGVARRANGRWQTFDMSSGSLPNNMVQALAETRDEAGQHEVWVGTRSGLAVFKGDRWHRDVGGEELPHRSVQVLLSESRRPGEETVWIGTGAGVVQYSQGRFAAIEVPLHNASVQSLAVVEAPTGRRELWIGTDGGGVARLDLSAVPVALDSLSDEGTPPLPNNVVYQILQDRLGRVYLATNRGVARLRWRQEGDREFDVTTFTVEDGLLSNQGSRGAGAVDWLGRLWVGTVGGVAVLDPSREEEDHTAKPLILEAFTQGGEPSNVSSGDRLSRGRGRIVFDYALLSFFREGDTRYQTQLAPLEQRPNGWVRDARREVGPLPPDDYTFRVWGRDYAGNVTGPAEVSFTVLPRVWQTWWALGLYAMVLAGGIAALVRIRFRAHRRQQQALRQLVDARTRELKDANQVLNELSYLDPLTGIGNRRRFAERLDHEWRRALRARGPLSLIMIDIDFFKPFNDTNGHQKGDACLRAIAGALADGLPRAGDSVARYGGEEFAVILPLTDRDGAVTLAESLRQRIQALAIPHAASPIASVVTISCGVATVTPSPEIASSELTRLADESLYVAKHTGRNRTVAEHGAPRVADSAMGSSGTYPE